MFFFAFMLPICSLVGASLVVFMHIHTMSISLRMALVLGLWQMLNMLSYWYETRSLNVDLYGPKEKFASWEVCFVGAQRGKALRKETWTREGVLLARKAIALAVGVV